MPCYLSFLRLINFTDGAQYPVEGFIIIAQQDDEFAYGFFQPGRIAHLQVNVMGLQQMGCQQFTGWQILVAQNVAEVAKAIIGGKVKNSSALQEKISSSESGGRGGSRWESFAVFLITDKQYADFRWNVAVDTVVLDQQITDVVSGHQLAHQAVIINVNVVYQPEYLVVG